MKPLIRRMEVADIPDVTALDHQCFSLPWPERSYHYEVTSNENSIPLVATFPDDWGNYQPGRFHCGLDDY